MTVTRMVVRPASGHPFHTPRAWHAPRGCGVAQGVPGPLSVLRSGPREAPSRPSLAARAPSRRPLSPRDPQRLPKSFGTSFGSFFGRFFRRIGPILLKNLPKKSPDVSEGRSEQASEFSTPAFQKNSETARISLFSGPARYVSVRQNSLREFCTPDRCRSHPRPPGGGRVAPCAPACAGGGASRRLRLQLVGRTLPAWGWFPAPRGAGAAEEPEGRELTS